MFLKRIVLSGFKSFADKTELEFGKGISAVVGPNGSGKSNISDAIRWVLGEQSAKNLRGGNMQEIIFAGSDSRKPVNFADVSLTLDNTSGALPLDFSEVTVTRRLHRSGESEYFINKQSCRLRDITELFMDTGIGKEAYSIIGQGRIEEILSTRSEDRRAIFEEASGIVKYKTRKKDAQRKLDDTEQNILRIHDLLSELEDQLEPLKQQSEKAKSYKKLKEELSSHEIALYVYQIEDVHRQWQEGTERLKQLEEEQAKWAAIVGQHDALLASDREMIRKLDEQLQQLQADLLQVSEEVEKSEGQGEVLRERERNLQQNKQRLSEALENMQKRTAETEHEINQARLKHEKIKAELNKIADKLTQEEERYSGVSASKDSEEERLKSELLDVLNDAANHRNEIRYANQQIESLEKRFARLQEEYRQDESKLDEASRKLEQLKADQVMLRQKLEEAGASFEKQSEDLQREKQLLQEAETALRKWQQHYGTISSRYHALKDMQSDYDGYVHGVKEVLKAGRDHRLRGIYGAVAELIAVPKDIETAIETALGGALQYIVTQDEASAREAIAYLKQRRAGRATFLPLDVMKPRQIPSYERNLIEQAEGFIGIGSELVKHDEKFASIVSYLLGHVLITETLEQANRVAAICKYRYRAVTLEGDVVNAGGSMSGGSLQRKGNGLLGRQRQLEELEKQTVKAEEQMKQIEQKTAQLRQSLQERASRMDRLKEKGNQIKMELARIETEKNHHESEKAAIETRLNVHQQELRSAEEELNQMRQNKADAEAKLQKAQALEQDIQVQIEQAEAARKQRETAKNEMQAQLTDLKVRHASISREKEAVEDQLNRLNKELQTLNKEKQTNEQALSQVMAEIERTAQEKTAQIQRLNDAKIKKEECTKRIAFIRAEKAEKEAALQQKENETIDQRRQLKQTEEWMHQTEVKVNRLDVQLDHLLKSLAEDYEISFELAKQRYGVPEDVDGAKERVKELKRQISALGEVNLGSIEEYERVSERHAFLTKQYEDLTEAKNHLDEVIREMEKEMSQRFEATFSEIRVHFSSVFHQLFGGGRADLILTEPENMLETGIEIVAQPPGKKLQNLQLLSGGERALTAIALLFAILNVKPVPFCVLDEVEAALDEANVSRFAQYLRKFSETTQFIVVTHRKGTMEEADVLYGVTMEEDGVSKLVSVKLDEDSEVITA